MNDRRLIRNSIITPDGTVLQSKSRHDYVTYTDKNGKEYMVDGGLDYCRCSAHGDEINNCLYDDESHEVQREVLKWGTYGKSGTEPLRVVKIGDMETDHIQACLQNIPGMHPVLKNCMKKELLYRDE